MRRRRVRAGPPLTEEASAPTATATATGHGTSVPWVHDNLLPSRVRVVVNDEPREGKPTEEINTHHESTTMPHIGNLAFFILDFFLNSIALNHFFYLEYPKLFDLYADRGGL